MRNKKSVDNSDVFRDVNIIEGDVSDIATLVQATAGIDTIIDVHGCSPPRFSKPWDLFLRPEKSRNHPYVVNFKGTKNILVAMHANNVGKLVRITGATVNKSPFNLITCLFNLLLSMTNKWHERSEKAIRDSGVDYTVIRPTEIRSEPPASESNRSLLLIPGDSRIQAPLPGKISKEDLADLLVMAASDTRLSRVTAIASSVAGSPHDISANICSKTWEPLVALQQADTRAITTSPHNAALSVFVSSLALGMSGIFLMVKFVIFTVLLRP
jgi:hypothetical protein